MAIAKSHTQEGRSQEFMRIPLTRECSVELRFVGKLDQKAITNLLRHIELTKEIWVDSD